ncbi:MAG: hypothetical protein ACXABO_20835 [Promethearchaeota archaeon]|jgi:hypothetical protein
MSKKGVYLVLIIFFSVIITSVSINVKANPPQEMYLDYSTNTQVLNVTIVHAVDDPNSHYVQYIGVSINSTTIINQAYTSQPDPVIFSYVYNITASNGDNIQAIATCNVGGSIAACIIVGSGLCPQTGGADIPGYLGFLLILTVSMLIVIPLVYRKIR